jgi:superfamily II DNA or RNA helicase
VGGKILGCQPSLQPEPSRHFLTTLVSHTVVFGKMAAGLELNPGPRWRFRGGRGSRANAGQPPWLRLAWERLDFGGSIADPLGMTFICKECPTDKCSRTEPLICYREARSQRTTGLPLRGYQLEAIGAVTAAEARGVKKQLVVLPPAAGKTIVAAELIRRRGGRGLILAHRDELIGQAGEKYLMVDPAAEIGVVKAGRNEVDAPVVVASVQTLAHPGRLAALADGFRTVVVDEAHHAVAPTYRMILEHVVGEESLLLGVTATADRGDGRGLDAVFDEIVYVESMPKLIADRYLCDLRGLQIRVRSDFAGLQVRAGDFVDAQCEQLLMAGGGPIVVAEAWGKFARGRRGLVFTPTVAVAHTMAQALRHTGVTAEALDGNMALYQRRAIISRLHDGATDVVCNCAVLTEGFDEPALDCIVVARPTRSRGLYTQMVGRGTRRDFGKENCLILDVVGATARHDLVTLASLAGVDGAVLAHRTVTEALHMNRPTSPEPGTWMAEIVAHEVDLFRRRPMRWVQVGRGFVVATRQGFVAVQPSDRRWRVSIRCGGETNIVADGLSLGFAQGVAEDLVRQSGSAHLADAHASCRRRPATEKQLALLRRWGIATCPGMTAGEASERISGRQAAAEF